MQFQHFHSMCVFFSFLNIGMKCNNAFEKNELTMNFTLKSIYVALIYYFKQKKNYSFSSYTIIYYCSFQLRINVIFKYLSVLQEKQTHKSNVHSIHLSMYMSTYNNTYIQRVCIVYECQCITITVNIY